MRASVNISELRLNDGSVIQLPSNGTVLIVGPNNAGKSQTLRDIFHLATSAGATGVVATGAQVNYVGSMEDLLETFREDGTLIQSAAASDRVAIGASGLQQLNLIEMSWTSGAKANVAEYFLLTANTESRLNASKPARALDLYEKTPNHSLHHLYNNRNVERRLDKISQEAFGRGLFLDTWGGGDSWSLRVGEIEPPNDPRPTQAFLEALRALPLLQHEGDGVRSMIGLLLEMFTGHQSISLLDEPEAFLHPPQARYLAKVLSETSRDTSSTIFMSTHSADIVHGTLEGPAPTTVIRLSRNGTLNHAAVLENDAVRRLWSDPLLRYSNLLEGLFTDAVVVCESDADCKFFASMRDGLAPPEDGSRRPDLLFTSCGGKHRMHVAVEALRASSVPVAVIGDFDVLNDWVVLSRLVIAAGGDPSVLERDWQIMNSALMSNSRTPSVAGMRQAVNDAFDEITEVSPRQLEPVRAALKIENGWDRVKNTGLAGVPKGDPYSSAGRLLANLQAMSIHLIPVGEMEDFVPEIRGHGPAWLSELLEHRLHESASTDGARAFFGGVLEALAPRPTWHAPAESI